MPQLLTMLLAVSAAAVIATGAVGPRADESEAGGAVMIEPAPELQAAARGENCLSAGDMREAVADKRVVPPFTAIRAARAVLPRAEIQRARLCHQEEKLIYLLTALRRDGHFVHVLVDAQSGQVAGQW